MFFKVYYAKSAIRDQLEQEVHNQTTSSKRQADEPLGLAQSVSTASDSFSSVFNEEDLGNADEHYDKEEEVALGHT